MNHATTWELRQPEQIRHYVTAGLWFARAAPLTPTTVANTLRWLLCLSSEGHAVPPSGFFADVGYLVLGTQEESLASSVELPDVEAGLLRRYEDYVLGKLYADLSFERGADAVLRSPAEDRDRAIAWLMHRVLARTGFAGAMINPAAVRALQQLPPEELLSTGWQQLAAEGPPPELAQQMEALIAAIQATGDLLAAEDLFEMERGIALADYGQRVALRQVLRAATALGQDIPPQRPRSRQRRQVATRLLEEDAYPVGGFSSISTKGTIESLLHSQLAYLETDERPDLFDIKYVRDELLYYARDENQFLRRRTTLLVGLAPDLVVARCKDATLPFQRIVMVLGLLVAFTHKLAEWLSDEALECHLVWITHQGSALLADEQALLELLLAEQVEHGTARVESMSPAAFAELAGRYARRSQVRGLIFSTTMNDLLSHEDTVARLLVDAPQPTLWDQGEVFLSEEPGLAAWRSVLQKLLLHTL